MTKSSGSAHDCNAKCSRNTAVRKRPAARRRRRRTAVAGKAKSALRTKRRPRKVRKKPAIAVRPIRKPRQLRGPVPRGWYKVVDFLKHQVQKRPEDTSPDSWQLVHVLHTTWGPRKARQEGGRYAYWKYDVWAEVNWYTGMSCCVEIPRGVVRRTDWPGETDDSGFDRTDGYMPTGVYFVKARHYDMRNYQPVIKLEDPIPDEFPTALVTAVHPLGSAHDFEWLIRSRGHVLSRTKRDKLEEMLSPYETSTVASDTNATVGQFSPTDSSRTSRPWSASSDEEESNYI